MPDAPIEISHALLDEVARVAEPHHHAMLTAIREHFGDDTAQTMHTIALAMMLGVALKAIPNAHRAPDGVALVWAAMGVPFVLEAKRTN